MYDTTGKSLQPVDQAQVTGPSPLGLTCAEVEIAVSTTGDWIRVSQGGVTLEEGHRISSAQLANLLRSLGHAVTEIEVAEDEF